MRFVPVTSTRYVPAPGDVFTTSLPYATEEYLATDERDHAGGACTFTALSLTRFELRRFMLPTPDEMRHPACPVYTKIGQIEGDQHA